MVLPGEEGNFGQNNQSGNPFGITAAGHAGAGEISRLIQRRKRRENGGEAWEVVPQLTWPISSCQSRSCRTVLRVTEPKSCPPADQLFWLANVLNSNQVESTLTIPMNPSTKRRFLALFWALILLPCVAAAQFTLSTNNGAITITKCTGPAGEVIIPGTTNGLPVTSVAAYAFYYAAGVTSVVVPASVTSIASTAFECGSLTNILVDSLNPAYSSLGGVLLDKTQNTLVEYPAGKAGPYTVPNSVTVIRGWAFDGCANLTGITFPAGLANIDTAAFQSCSGLSGAVTIPNAITNLGDNAFFGCASLTSASVPIHPKYFGTAVFSGCSGLTNVTVPSNLCSLPSSVFQSCSRLRDFMLPSTVTNIGSRAFEGCSSLDGIALSTGLIEIGDYAFISCTSLREIALPASVTTLGPATFEHCTGLTNVLLPNGLTSIGGYAFYDCQSLTDIVIPGSVTNIDFWAFHSCTALQSVMLMNSPTIIGQSAFYNCPALTVVSLGNRVRSIEAYGFGYCTGLTNVAVPDTAAKVGDMAFYGCTSLAYATVGASVTNIGYQAFSGCSVLRGVFFGGKAPTTFGPQTFLGDTLVTVYYLPGKTGWGSTFDTSPTALWNPNIQSSGSNFGIKSGRFGFNITGTANIPIVIDACTNISSPWTLLKSCTLTNGLMYFSDASWASYPARCYRIRSP
jgi:hypothetical protein